MVTKFSFGRSFRRDYIANSVQESTCPVKGLDRINGAVARIRDGPVFRPAVLELSELPCTDGSHRCRGVLDFHHLALLFTHALTDRLEEHS